MRGINMENYLEYLDKLQKEMTWMKKSVETS